MFLAERLLMIKGSSANIGEVLDLSFACPRVRVRIMEAWQYYKLCDYRSC
ncbi:hypothetical protein [Chlorogloea sp. CCALA 695]|nr:hypothetical protein [Chlorogloea sp. CCALA 695]